MAEQGTLTCLCGRSFAHEYAYSKHQRYGCAKSKKRLLGALLKAKEIVLAKKRRRLDSTNEVLHPSYMDVDCSADVSTSFESPPCDSLAQASGTNRPELPTQETEREASAEQADDSLSLAERRPRRLNRLLPRRYRDLLPQSAPTLPQPNSTPPPPPDSVANSNTVNPLHPRTRRIFRTPRNIFGLVRQYFTTELPPVDPEELVTLTDLCSNPPDSTADDSPCQPSGDATNFYPYPNRSSFRLGDWYWNGSLQKSQQSFKDLLNIVGDLNFDPSDVRDTKWDQINTTLANNAADDGEEEWLDEGIGWTKRRVEISVPFHHRMRHPGPRKYIGAELYHRSLVDVIKERLADPHTAARFHMEPYELLWQPTDQHPEVKIHGEAYNSQAFLDAHRTLHDSPGEPGCDLPRVVVALMFWSDSTHLTSFGNSHLWPCYLFFGNESKYRRCKPSHHLCTHVAYFEKLPDEFKDFAAEHVGGTGPKKAFVAHCRREFFHEQVKVLFDDEFVKAYEHGIVITCHDGIKRRFYPRIFTYSADYPEKVILAGIRNMGHCPCPRCCIPKERFQNLGMTRDRQQRSTLARVDNEDRKFKIAAARRLIYEKNYAVDSRALEKLLKDESLVPTSNAFSDKLQPLGFNLFLMLVVDLMHEFELGVWRALLIHLLRMLMSINPSLLHELDRRYRQVPTFGQDTIRKFRSNTSELKKMAARDFEDLLQCAIPVFDGLFPEPHNTAIMRLLFTCAHWHGLAKLRMHSDLTLDVLDDVTTVLGQAFRHFQRNICPTYNTRELPREADARRRRHRSNKADQSAETDNGGRSKEFNLHTFKYHSLGDTVQTIRMFGTTDSYNTAVGELEHRTSKKRYFRTDRKFFVRQLTRIERRQTRIRRIKKKNASQMRDPCEDVATTPDVHHHIGLSENSFDHIGTFLRANSDDRAVKDFLPKLKEHLLPRIKALVNSDNPAFSEDTTVAGITTLPTPNVSELDNILFKHDRIYRHKIMRINYTTYDVRRKQDTINPATPHRNIMVLADSSDSSDHPFLYGRVIGIFHANVVYTGFRTVDYRPRRLEFLWVRWYELDPNVPAGSWTCGTLDRLRFPPMAEPGAFGFIDPSDVVRACHIIPAFASGKRYGDGRGLSRCAMDSDDWNSYYLMRFVDRDMVLRYHWGIAVGHVYTHQQPSTHEGVSCSRANDTYYRDNVPQMPDSRNLCQGDDGAHDLEQLQEQLPERNVDAGPEIYDHFADSEGNSMSDDSNSDGHESCRWEDASGEDASDFSDEQDLLDFDVMYGSGPYDEDED